MNFSGRESVALLKEYIMGGEQRKPRKPIPMAEFHPNSFRMRNDISFVWFGHSALLLNWHGRLMLIDPMFGRTPSPFPWFGGNRYSGKLPFEIDTLPPIDAVFLSHDHYDHLDFTSIRKLKDRVKQFHVPLGVGAHLRRWGVKAEHIHEHDWWEEWIWDGLTIATAPARHFSGRSLTDRNATLWCSWIFVDPTTRIFYSGDSGYGPHFREIGEKYGPFDWAFMEAGQYNERWQAIHMMPEETVQATMDVQASHLVPVHWGAFTLSLHDWFDPPQRVMQAAKNTGVKVITPMIGEVVNIAQRPLPLHPWWEPTREGT
jgi:L-ascorbate metabolism protein UlaG (beta-lactamase superfamily)